jgi:hypothetical protein
MAKKKSAKPSASTGKKPKHKNTRQDKLAGQQPGEPFSNQDPKRRIGNFGTAGEHPRQGGRTTGIVGQTKQRNRTDKRSKKG